MTQNWKTNITLSKRTWISGLVRLVSHWAMSFVWSCKSTECTTWIHKGPFALCPISFDAPHAADDHCITYHLCKDLVLKTNATTWFKKVQNDNRRTAYRFLPLASITTSNGVSSATSNLEKLLLQHKQQCSKTWRTVKSLRWQMLPDGSQVSSPLLGWMILILLGTTMLCFLANWFKNWMHSISASPQSSLSLFLLVGGNNCNFKFTHTETELCVQQGLVH